MRLDFSVCFNSSNKKIHDSEANDNNLQPFLDAGDTEIEGAIRHCVCCNQTTDKVQFLISEIHICATKFFKHLKAESDLEKKNLNK